MFYCKCLFLFFIAVKNINIVQANIFFYFRSLDTFIYAKMYLEYAASCFNLAKIIVFLDFHFRKSKLFDHTKHKKTCSSRIANVIFDFLQQQFLF